jgi:SAM-dependent methyltransferase
MSGENNRGLWRRDSEIFFVSVLILYLELVLIRWIGTEIRVFAYLGNLILVVCFFGVGLGCYLSSRQPSVTRTAVNLALLAWLVGDLLHAGPLGSDKVTPLLSAFEDYSLFILFPRASSLYLLAGLLVVGALLYLVVFSFVPLGQILGRALQEHPAPIRAYSVNITGSLLGVWLFNWLSWARQPPAVWFALGAVLWVLLIWVRRQRKWVSACLMACAALVVWLGHGAGTQTVWSPYHKLTIVPFEAVEGTNHVQQGYVMGVNGTFYQHILNFDDSFFRQHPAIFDMERIKLAHYNLPFHFKAHIRRLLVVGAGAGNNAAAALRHDVEQVDCVEIDPQIYEFGKELHPERPYDSPRLRMEVNDARAFFKQASGPYDMIWFAFLDSHTLGSSYNNLRLDHYVYTLESLREARRLLADDGVLIVNFGMMAPWLGDRMFGLVREVFGHEPLAYIEEHNEEKYGYGGGVTLVCANAPLTVATIRDRVVRNYIAAHRFKPDKPVRLTTDDWPYLYLRSPRIPKLHLLVSFTILGAAALAGRRVFGFRTGLDYHFFALGAAFLLLEVQTVSRATLLFGMTWVVNAIVISAVLAMILLANLVAWRSPRLPQWFIVAGLVITIALLALVPLDWFNALTGASKLVAASAFLTAPVFFSGLIFIRSFAACSDKSRALGSNLIGALVGGLLESLSFVTGIRALVLLVALFYVVALGLRPHLAQNAKAAG